MNIEIEFHGNKTLVVQEIPDNEKHNHYDYDYELYFKKEDLYPNIEGYIYAPSIEHQPVNDIRCGQHFISLYYLDKYDEMDNLNEALEVFNLWDKSYDEIFSFRNQEFIETEMKDIPDLKRSEILNIKFI